MESTVHVETSSPRLSRIKSSKKVKDDTDESLSLSLSLYVPEPARTCAAILQRTIASPITSLAMRAHAHLNIQHLLFGLKDSYKSTQSIIQI